MRKFVRRSVGNKPLELCFSCVGRAKLGTGPGRTPSEPIQCLCPPERAASCGHPSPWTCACSIISDVPTWTAARCARSKYLFSMTRLENAQMDGGMVHCLTLKGTSYYGPLRSRNRLAFYGNETAPRNRALKYRSCTHRFRLGRSFGSRLPTRRLGARERCGFWFLVPVRWTPWLLSVR